MDDAAWFDCAGARDGRDAGWVNGLRVRVGAGRNKLVCIREQKVWIYLGRDGVVIGRWESMVKG